MMNRVTPRANHSGNTMVEYALIGTSVVVVCMVAFLSVGTNLQAWLSGLKTDMAQHAQHAKASQIAVAHTDQNSGNDNNSSVDAGSIRVHPSKPNVLCGSDFCVYAPGLTGTSVATAGSNGNINITESAANVYTQLAQIAESKGTDAYSVRLLTRLAGTGHRIADLQKALVANRNELRGLSADPSDTGLDSASTDLSSACMSWGVSCTGMSTSDTGLYSSGIGISAASGGKPKSKMDYFQTMHSEAYRVRDRLKDFRALATEMEQSIENYPEETRPLLTGAANVILQVGGTFRYGVQVDKETGDKRLRFSYLTDTKKVQLIHTKSNTICDNGGDQTKCHRG